MLKSMRSDGSLTSFLLSSLFVLGICSPTSLAAPPPTPSAAQQAPGANNTARLMSPRSQQLARERIEKEAERAMENADAKPVEDALTIVQDTRKATKLIDEGQADQAKATIEQALGKVDVLLNDHPSAAWIPTAAAVNIVDTPISEDGAKRLSRQARKLVNDGHMQSARRLIRDLASEIEITTVNLPMATYPPALRSAATLIDQGKPQEARAQLSSALQTLAVIERTIPIPVLRAQALADEVSRQASENKIDKDQAKEYLKDADQQLTLAENLGYGTKKDFSQVRDSIKDARKNVDRGQDSKSILAKLKSGLEDLKSKISRSTSHA